MTDEGVFVIYRTPHRKLLPLLLISALIFLMIYVFLTNIHALLGSSWLGISVATPQNPLIDAAATALSCTGMWLISRKYMENWIVWIVVNVGYVAMYVAQANFFWAALFMLYLVMSFVGWAEWRKLHQQQQAVA